MRHPAQRAFLLRSTSEVRALCVGFCVKWRAALLECARQRGSSQVGMHSKLHARARGRNLGNLAGNAGGALCGETGASVARLISALSIREVTARKISKLRLWRALPPLLRPSPLSWCFALASFVAVASSPSSSLRSLGCSLSLSLLGMGFLSFDASELLGTTQQERRSPRQSCDNFDMCFRRFRPIG